MLDTGMMKADAEESAFDYLLGKLIQLSLDEPCRCEHPGFFSGGYTCTTCKLRDIILEVE